MSKLSTPGLGKEVYSSPFPFLTFMSFTSAGQRLRIFAKLSPISEAPAEPPAVLHLDLHDQLTIAQRVETSGLAAILICDP